MFPFSRNVLNSHFLFARSGYEDNFVWNVESSGAQRPYRILQKRGVIVDGDDYLPVTDTYPSHPMSDVKPTF